MSGLCVAKNRYVQLPRLLVLTHNSTCQHIRTTKHRITTAYKNKTKGRGLSQSQLVVSFEFRSARVFSTTNNDPITILKRNTCCINKTFSFFTYWIIVAKFIQSVFFFFFRHRKTVSLYVVHFGPTFEEFPQMMGF